MANLSIGNPPSEFDIALYSDNTCIAKGRVYKAAYQAEKVPIWYKDDYVCKIATSMGTLVLDYIDKTYRIDNLTVEQDIEPALKYPTIVLRDASNEHRIVDFNDLESDKEYTIILQRKIFNK